MILGLGRWLCCLLWLLAGEVVSAAEVVLAAVVVEQQRNLISDRFSVAKLLIDSTHMFHWYH